MLLRRFTYIVPQMSRQYSKKFEGSCSIAALQVYISWFMHTDNVFVAYNDCQVYPLVYTALS